MTVVDATCTKGEAMCADLSGPPVAGFCPMGCGETLTLGPDGAVTCSDDTCERPEAAAVLLGDNEPEHVVEVTSHGFTVRHPLRERLDDDLFVCSINDWLRELDGPPVDSGRYRVAWRGWKAPTGWEPING